MLSKGQCDDGDWERALRTLVGPYVEPSGYRQQGSQMPNLALFNRRPWQDNSISNTAPRDPEWYFYSGGSPATFYKPVFKWWCNLLFQVRNTDLAAKEEDGLWVNVTDALGHLFTFHPNETAAKLFAHILDKNHLSLQQTEYGARNAQEFDMYFGQFVKNPPCTKAWWKYVMDNPNAMWFADEVPNGWIWGTTEEDMLRDEDWLLDHPFGLHNLIYWDWSETYEGRIVRTVLRNHNVEKAKALYEAGLPYSQNGRGTMLTEYYQRIEYFVAHYGLPAVVEMVKTMREAEQRALAKEPQMRYWMQDPEYPPIERDAELVARLAQQNA